MSEVKDILKELEEADGSRFNAKKFEKLLVALINDEATLKRYYFDKKRKQVRLHPENVALDDLYYDKVNIQGIVKKVIKEVI